MNEKARIFRWIGRTSRLSLRSGVIFFPLAAGPHGHPNAAAALGTPAWPQALFHWRWAQPPPLPFDVDADADDPALQHDRRLQIARRVVLRAGHRGVDVRIERVEDVEFRCDSARAAEPERLAEAEVDLVDARRELGAGRLERHLHRRGRHV